jgi:hypothetical protein
MQAADPEIDRLLQNSVGKDWVTNGAWMTRLKATGFGGKYASAGA